MRIIFLFVKPIYKFITLIRNQFFYLFVKALLLYRGVEVIGKISIGGLPYIWKSPSAKIVINQGVRLNSGMEFNPVGSDEKMKIIVKGELIIGENAGISNSTIVCWEKISIGKRTLIGGGTKIYDTDFHPIHYSERVLMTSNNIMTAPISIGDDVFIGAHTIILKGVQIGKGSVIGAGSVVAKNVPEKQIWAGNPIRYIKSLE